MKAAIVCLLVFSIASSLQALPWKVLEKEQITGEIVSFTWVGDCQIQQESVLMNGPTGIKETSSYYYVRLKGTNLTNEECVEISNYSRNRNLRPKICSVFMPEDEVIIFFPSGLQEKIVEGATLKIEDCWAHGDEYTAWSKFSNVLIDGKKLVTGKKPDSDSKKAEQGVAAEPDRAGG
ncbi:hypothetical protein [Roseibacillus persicicus]|uniref:hypothetical protein n=1 Tax=Roseibacillus persicicus TaxID=454148 RepID=UPI00280D7F47|nr:hypothetical protein [Roseibacillus persicicus]MDQ8192721.1 hypothetical protein [Roseibacillus persicicus]